MKKIWQIQLDAFSEKRFNAKHQLMVNGHEAWKSEFKTLYTHVATIDVDTAEDAFELCNLWNNPKLVEWKGECHSLSVGDVVEFEDGSWYLCDNFGWMEV